MGKFVMHVEIVTDNAAFGDTIEEKQEEALLIIKRMILGMEGEISVFEDDRRSLYDTNGNRVGEAWYETRP